MPSSDACCTASTGYEMHKLCCAVVVWIDMTRLHFSEKPSTIINATST